jgi:hypothetical protein
LDYIFENGIVNKLQLLASRINQSFNANNYDVKDKTVTRLRSNSPSPIRKKIENKQRSSSNESKNSKNKPYRNDFNLEENTMDLNINEDNYNSDDTKKECTGNVHPYRKLDLHTNIMDFSNKKDSTYSFDQIYNEINCFSGISLNNPVMCYAWSNGILFTPRQIGLRSNLFSKIVYNYIQSCFKIQAFFEMFNLKTVSIYEFHFEKDK